MSRPWDNIFSSAAPLSESSGKKSSLRPSHGSFGGAPFMSERREKGASLPPLAFLCVLQGGNQISPKMAAQNLKSERAGEGEPGEGVAYESNSAVLAVFTTERSAKKRRALREMPTMDEALPSVRARARGQKVDAFGSGVSAAVNQQHILEGGKLKWQIIITPEWEGA